MPDWEAELTALLHDLGVQVEGASAPHDPTPAPNASRRPIGVERWPLESGTLPAELPEEPMANDGDEVSAVRREIEATLARVVDLARAGLLDPALRDDVVFVLQALTRPRPRGLRARDRTEWQLASAAAVLHFCRVVLRLTQTLATEPGS
jgi:hypothetical protein